MDKLYLGKFVGVHGIKGELKLLTDFERMDKVIKNIKLYINDLEFVMSSIRPHKNVYLVTVNEIFDINKIDYLIGSEVYIDRNDLKLGSNEFLYSDLINSKVVEDERELGIIKEVLFNKSNDLIRVVGDAEFLIPLVPEYIKGYSLEEKTLYTNNAKSLII